jgi:hypothetical protein
MAKDPPAPTKRKGRPLLLASLGVAAVSFVACNDPKAPDGPVGNLRGPDPVPADAAQPVPDPTPEHHPVGNLRPPDPPDPPPVVPDAGPAPDAGKVGAIAPTTTATTKPAPTATPKPPDPKHHPVGNLRAPESGGQSQ